MILGFAFIFKNEAVEKSSVHGGVGDWQILLKVKQIETSHYVLPPLTARFQKAFALDHFLLYWLSWVYPNNSISLKK